MKKQYWRANNGDGSSVNYTIIWSCLKSSLQNYQPKNMPNLTQIAIICLSLTIALAQLCSNVPDSSFLIQAGTVSVVNSGLPTASRLHSYPIAITYIVPASGFQVAASVGSWILSNQFSNNWDFSVRGGAGESASSARIVVIISDDVGWKSLAVNYLISSRSDLFLGAFIADGYIFQSTGNNQVTLAYSIPDWQPTERQVISTVQFAGVRTYLSQSLSLHFVNTAVNAQTGVLTVVMNTNTAFELLYFTYFWFVTGAGQIQFSTFYAGLSAQLAYPFVGIEGIVGSLISYAGSGFNVNGLLSCSGSRCTKQCVTENGCREIGGVVSGNQCSTCGVNSQWNGNLCVCINNYYLINGVCAQCQANSVWNGNSCVCLSGFMLLNGNCVSCPALSLWIQAQQACVCISGYYMSNGACLTCIANSVWTGSACVCLSGYYLVNGICQLLPANSVFNGNGFVCASNFFLINGACLACDPNSIYNGTTCNCKTGFLGNYQLCTACHATCVTCSQNGPNGCTSCPNGITLNNGACFAGCGNGRVLVNSVCVDCPNSCVTCSDQDTCTQCAQSYNLVQQVGNGNLVVGCVLPGPVVPGSALALTGTVVGNNLIYQGVTLSSLPAYFLTNNCADCSDLFLVNVIPNKLGITYTVEYVQYSQYWFVISFNYGSSGITPQFQFKVQLNFKYANYFTPADMAQGKFSSITASQYPNTHTSQTTPNPRPVAPNPRNSTFSSGAAPVAAPSGSSLSKKSLLSLFGS